MTNEAPKKSSRNTSDKEVDRRAGLYERSQHVVRARVSGPDGTWTGIIRAALDPKGQPVLRVDNEVPEGGFDPAGALISTYSHMDKVHTITGDIVVLPMRGKKEDVRPASVIRPIVKFRKARKLDDAGKPLLGEDSQPLIENIAYAMLRVDAPAADEEA